MPEMVSVSLSLLFYEQVKVISLFRRAFQFTICNGTTNALVCNKTLIQMSYIKTLKITPNMFRSSADHHQGAFDPS
jgi:hypothetical protein